MQPSPPPSSPPRADTELAVLNRIIQAMAHHHDLATLLHDVLDIIETELGMTCATLTLRLPGSDVFEIETSRGLTEHEQSRGRYLLGEGVTGQVAQTGQPALIPDIRSDPRFLNRTGSRAGQTVAFICVPVKHHHEVIGTFSVDRAKPDDATLKRDLNFLAIVANILAEAVVGIQEQRAATDALRAENQRLRRELGDMYRPRNIRGNCSNMRVVYQQIAQVADSQATVLIRGESGTGKELVAHAIHYASSRLDHPFVRVNCAALPETLIESELFGHEKGAFTGALQQRKGRFELANGGTLFLDEIGDISPAVQVRLLRVIQERCFERVGGNQTIKVNVRLLAATSKNLEEAIRDGRFRDDLYYRLNVFPIHMPALRERRSDIILLADHFLQKYNDVYHKQIKRISTPAINMMMAYHWPGNVRELENCIARAVLSSTDDVIHGYTLPPSLQTSEATNTAMLPDSGASLRAMVDAFEREIIVDTLKKHRGNAAAAARMLQVTPRIMNYRIKRLGIAPHNFK